MTPKTLKALKASIKHWEENARMRKPRSANIGPMSCALCKLFYGDPGIESPSDCVGCPVYRKTKKKYCDGSPHPRVVDARHDWGCGNVELSVFRSAANDMVDFLKSLLPKRKPAGRK